MSKLLKVVFSLLLVATLAAGCSQGNETPENNAPENGEVAQPENGSEPQVCGDVSLEMSTSS